MSSPDHPIEEVYAARSALDRAASLQARNEVMQQDWPAFGSALLGMLGSLDNLTHVLVDQLDGADRQALYQAALRDHPHEALDRAVSDLNHLRQVLATAVSDADNYWSEARHIREDTTTRGPEESG